MFGFRSKFCANLTGGGGSGGGDSFVQFCAVSCLNGYPGIETSVNIIWFLQFVWNQIYQVYILTTHQYVFESYFLF